MALKPKPSAVAPLNETIRRVGRLEVRARQVVEGFLSGLHRSPYFGQSLEFREHRQYAHGDDPRHIDWKVWARQDRYYIKRYEEDTNLRCALLVDRSASMAYGGGATSKGGLTKHQYASTAACVLAYLLLRQNDAAGCLPFDSRLYAGVPIRSARGHINTIAELLEGITPARNPEKPTDLERVLQESAARLPRRGLVVLISDLMGDAEGLRRGLGLLRQRGHELLVLHVLDDDELDFPFNASTRFVGLESDQELTCNPRALRRGYLEAMERFLQRSRHACLAAGADYSLLRTSAPLDAALTALLSMNARPRRV